jgi:hypothetical protein
MKIKILLFVLAAMFVTGCASSRMIDANDQALAAPSPDKARIVFVRSSFVGSAIQAAIYDATGGGTEFVGILSNDKKLAWEVDPGKHTFMVISEAADFMEANVSAGKTYYAIVTPRMGAWKARFSMYPVRNGGPGQFQIDSADFRGWMQSSRFSQNTDDSYAWARENESSVMKKQSEYWEVWQQKTPEALAERTLNPDDGV